MTATTGQTALIIGASRGLGYALAAEYLARGWQVTATVRGARRTELHDLAASSAGRLIVETVDITVPEQVAALHDRLAQTTFDLLFVNAGVTNGPQETVSAGRSRRAPHDRPEHPRCGRHDRGPGGPGRAAVPGLPGQDRPLVGAPGPPLMTWRAST